MSRDLLPEPTGSRPRSKPRQMTERERGLAVPLTPPPLAAHGTHRPHTQPRGLRWGGSARGQSAAVKYATRQRLLTSPHDVTHRHPSLQRDRYLNYTTLHPGEPWVAVTGKH